MVCRKRRCQSLGYPYTVRKELTFTSISTLYPAFNSFFFFARSFVNESSGLRHSKSGEIAAHSIRGRAGLSFLLLLSFYQSTRPLFLYTFSYIACFLSCLASLLFVFFVFFLPSRAFRCWLFLRSIFMNGFGNLSLTVRDDKLLNYRSTIEPHSLNSVLVLGHQCFALYTLWALTSSRIATNLHIKNKNNAKHRI